MDSAEHRHLDALIAGDEAAFEELVATYHHRLFRVARLYVRTDAQAHDVVQETWLAVLRGLRGFERRSSLKTWLFHIAANRARTHAVREGRMVPVSALAPDEGADGEASWFDDRGRWAEPPMAWASSDPEALLLNGEVRAALTRAIDTLPDGQRAVVVLRDLEGLDAPAACNVLGISETNQRVLLHRGRTKVRAALAEQVGRRTP
ncbi:MAG: RNA polymerase sigma factor [Vicinamibacterales bacterium]